MSNCYNYLGQPSNVETVKRVSMASATSSKLKLFFSHLLCCIEALRISPSSKTI